MKKIIITLAIAASISLGFTLIESKKTPGKVIQVETVKSSDFEKSDLSVESQDKRLASWD